MSRKDDANRQYNELINNFNTDYPRAVVGLYNSSVFYYQNHLYNVFKSCYRLKNIPDTWDDDYIYDNLFRIGYLAMVIHEGTSYCLRSGKTGYNVYHKPTNVLVSNVLLDMFEAEIGKDAELLYFNYNHGHYENITELITRYALQLAECDGTINTSLINSRVAHIFYGRTDAEIRTKQRIYDEVTAGKPAVFEKKPDGFQEDTPDEFINVREVFIAPEVFQLKKKIMDEFLTVIGIANANTDKKERLITDEVNSNNQQTQTLIEMFTDKMNQCLEKGNKMHKRYGIEFTNMKVEVKSLKDIEDPYKGLKKGADDE